MISKTLFIFRRDLRLEDNRGLISALSESDSVIPAFIFTPEQIETNPYRSDACLQFMIESLEDLSQQLKSQGGKLYLFFDSPESVVEKCIKKLQIDQVVVNRDYTPYSIKRDAKIAALCKKHKIPFKAFDDALLHPPEETLKENGKPYLIFTPYFRNASKLKVELPQKNRSKNYYRKPIDFSMGEELYKKILPKRNPNPFLPGGRVAALKILNKIGEKESYARLRDYPAENGTTHLSAYLKFTDISPREAYHGIADSLSKHHELIRALYWRDFFSHVAFFFPHVFKGAFHKKYDNLKWSYDKKAFLKWCEGKTGFPIVDAGMREMNETGYMHNRVRMIVASFLTKDLHIDWRLGEKYFAQKLIDYDPAVNNGNWQWAASTGCDAQPYFRIFNPWAQQKKFDPDCEYIKKWVPELDDFPPEMIHEGLATLPMIDHAKEAKVSLKNYKSSFLRK
jgi:deoxyribodipyrimidine photo-lyase